MEEFSSRAEHISERVDELREKYPDLDERKLWKYAALDSRQNKQKIAKHEFSKLRRFVGSGLQPLYSLFFIHRLY